MEGYLRGYYGYKNFGDELLFFGVAKRLFTKYPLTKLFVEVGNKSWMDDRVRENYQGLLTEKQLNAIKLVPAKQHPHKWITHLVNFLGFGKYRKIFKFFGGGEVLSDERPFPHDGWNLPILFNQSIREGKFILLGGIGKTRKKWTEKLYTYLLPKAEKIVVRDKDSFAIVKKYNPDNVVMYQDFAQETILSYEGRVTSDPAKDTSFGAGEGRVTSKKNLVTSNSKLKTSYILININKQMVNEEHIRKIVEFCQQHPQHKKIFFPCDMGDDVHCFSIIKKHISGLEMYDRTKHSLQESLSLFYHADGGIGARLHFLLPLKLYGKPIVAIPYADKINKLIS